MLAGADQYESRTMAPAPMDEVKLCALTLEMDGIDFVNTLYWGRIEATTPRAKQEIRRRTDRLEEIRAVLARLRKYPRLR
jgi:hypothetical protein